MLGNNPSISRMSPNTTVPITRNSVTTLIKNFILNPFFKIRREVGICTLHRLTSGFKPDNSFRVSRHGCTPVMVKGIEPLRIVRAFTYFATLLQLLVDFL